MAGAQSSWTQEEAVSAVTTRRTLSDKVLTLEFQAVWGPAARGHRADEKAVREVNANVLNQEMENSDSGMSDIIVIGAGGCGLMAALVAAKKGAQNQRRVGCCRVEAGKIAEVALVRQTRNLKAAPGHRIQVKTYAINLIGFEFCATPLDFHPL